MKRWTQYFTPPDVARFLIDGIQRSKAPRSAVDICAGSGNLLHAVAQRWPLALTVGNDRYRSVKPSGVNSWSSRDGREFALDHLRRGTVYDLVVANPPFGNSKALSVKTTSLSVEERALLNETRVEASMTVAAALLVAPRGVLATVLPETVLWGERHSDLRAWLSKEFCCFDISRLSRSAFQRQDLGLLVARCYRKHTGSCRGSILAVRPERNHSEYEISRGSLHSQELNPRGSISVVHCAGGYGEEPFTWRATTVAKTRGRELGLLKSGDVLISRVGRGAGRTALFRGLETLHTDCVFRVRALESARAELHRIVRSGRLEAMLRRRVHGLSAQFITKQDIESAIGLCLNNA